jgi:hypothetical protein
VSDYWAWLNVSNVGVLSGASPDRQRPLVCGRSVAPTETCTPVAERSGGAILTWWRRQRQSAGVRIKITLAIGLTLTAAAVIAVLQRSPLTVAASNGIPVTSQLGAVRGAGAYCQPDEALPARISAIRLSLGATTGPRIAVTVLSGKRLITSGTVASGWYGSAVTVPVRPLPHAHSPVTICARFRALNGIVAVLGVTAGPTVAGRGGFLPGRLRIVCLRPANRSWWSLAGSVIDHLALGRAVSGRWVVFAIVALIATAIALASLALSRELR